MTECELAYEISRYANWYPSAPEGWEPLATLPIKREALVEYLRADGSTDQDYGVTHLQFIIPASVPVAWREVTSGPLYEWWLDRLMRISARMELPYE